MKKFYIIVAMALAGLTASAQQTLNLSTYTGTDIAKYHGQAKKVSVNRYLFKGWNTICLPFSMSREEIEEAFGSDCRLETLVGVDNEGSEVTLIFQNTKSKGLKANIPYILYYNKESQNVKFTSENALIKDEEASVSFIDKYGTKVTFEASKKQKKSTGLYGIYAKDNAEATFVNVDNAQNGFLATRCYINLSSGTNAKLHTNHIGEDDITAITSVIKAGELVDVFNVSGIKISSNASISDINRLNSGIYVVKGKKIAVK